MRCELDDAAGITASSGGLKMRGFGVDCSLFFKPFASILQVASRPQKAT